MVSRMGALSIAALIVRRNLASKGLAIERLSDKRPKPFALSHPARTGLSPRLGDPRRMPACSLWWCDHWRCRRRTSWRGCKSPSATFCRAAKRRLFRAHGRAQSYRHPRERGAEASQPHSSAPQSPCLCFVPFAQARARWVAAASGKHSKQTGQLGSLISHRIKKGKGPSATGLQVEE